LALLGFMWVREPARGRRSGSRWPS
jgi:hypothetical protein